MDPKEKRNAQIIELHNEGLSTQKIADKVGISKAAVYKVVTAYLETVKGSTKPAATPEPEPATMQTGNAETVTGTPAKVKQSAPALNGIESGQRITNFGELQYTGNPNEYAHKQTGQVIKVKFVRATAQDQCGHFVAV